MKLEQAKALFFAQYLGQKVFTHDKYGEEGPVENDTMRISWILQPGVRDDGYYLLLRSVSQLTDEEKVIIGERMQIYPEDVIDWINGDCGHDDFENLNTWLPCYDILKAFGILLPFTYLNETNTPVTLQPHEIIEMGWVKLLTD